MKERIKLYCSLMEEAKARLEIINATYYNPQNFPPMVVRENCYLQFRFICEIIALACLAAHGDIPEARAVKDKYEPSKILKQLAKLNPFFYPQPMELIRDEESKQAAFTGRPESNHLSQKELPTLWGRAGDILHRTPMVKVLAQQNTPQDDDFTDIFDWSAKLVGLLNTHWITLQENKKGMFVSLKAKETNKVAVTILDFKENGAVELSNTWVV